MEKLRPHIIKKIAATSLNIALAASVCFADSNYKETFSQTTPAELPAKVAGLINEAKPRERERVTLDSVKAAMELNPAIATAIVSAIARATPEVAAVAASVAAAEQPKQAAAIARAAAVAAPARPGKIVAAVCRAVPNAYRDIAVGVAQAVPGTDKEVLNAVVTALPELKASLAGALARQGTNPPSVAAVLETKAPGSAGRNPGSTPAPLPRGSSAGQPQTSLTGTPTNIIPRASSKVLPGGGTEHAAP